MNPILTIIGALGSLFRTDYQLGNGVLTVKRPFRNDLRLAITDLQEIGLQTTDQGPFIEDVFWVLKWREERVRIGDPHPVFKELLERFRDFSDFDWETFTKAMSCTDNRYFRCWISRRGEVS